MLEFLNFFVTDFKCGANKCGCIELVLPIDLLLLPNTICPQTLNAVVVLDSEVSQESASSDASASAEHPNNRGIGKR